jgi:hypothetical protein
MMFLATHRDLVADGELPKVLAALHKRLREILLPAFKEQLIYCDTKGGDFIFPLNAAEPGKEDREWGKVIREALSKEGEGGKVVRVPLRWHALYQKLLQVANELGKKVLPRELCGKVAELLEIDEESCGEAVNFFHGLNMLFYFPAILPGLVFMEPQMLLDKVSELVDETYHMRNGKGEAMWGDRLKFRDHAQVTEKFLSIHGQGAGDAAERAAGVCRAVAGRVLHAVPAASCVIRGGGETPSERRASSGCPLPQQRSPDGNVLLHCGLPPLPRKQRRSF